MSEPRTAEERASETARYILEHEQACTCDASVGVTYCLDCALRELSESYLKYRDDNGSN